MVKPVKKADNLGSNTVLQTIKHNKDWTLSTWKNFRSLNDYWRTRDEAYKYGSLDAIFNFNLQKLKWIKEYNKQNR